MSRLPDFAAAAAAGKLRVLMLDARRLMRLTRYPDSEPHWGKSKTYRFDDAAQVFGVTYAALSLEVAFAETVLHQQGLFIDNQWVVDSARVRERHVVGFEHPGARLLNIADLTGAGLKALGLNNDLCSSDDYTNSMTVSSALHHQVPHVDGILYVSRQMNMGVAVALFERCGLRRDGFTVALERHPDLAGVLDLYHVAIVPDSTPV